MYLLIHVVLSTVLGADTFTSHYVSINSSRRNASIFELANLHPTMYLLIPSKTAILIIIVQRFTSHYVSINSNPITALNI